MSYHVTSAGHVIPPLFSCHVSSQDNFRTPNFELVADILDWLLHRFEPGIAIPDDISTESHRVHFIKSVVECPACEIY